MEDVNLIRQRILQRRYIKHSAYLKADVNITGEEKESAISDLDKKIKELSESMGVNKQE